MTEASLTSAPAANLPAKPPTNSLLRHAIYVVADNPVTGLSFGLFILIALCALVGPYVVPYDPLASDTTATLQSPSWQHWFGTDLVGRCVERRTTSSTAGSGTGRCPGSCMCRPGGSGCWRSG